MEVTSKLGTIVKYVLVPIQRRKLSDHIMVLGNTVDVKIEGRIVFVMHFRTI